MSNGIRKQATGPFRAFQIRSGDPYELSQGHPIQCAPTGADGTGPNGLGFAVLDSDPSVRTAGVDTGIQLSDDTLRAPDIAVNFERGEGTWATSAPLVVEYAGRGQDEADLKVKIGELLAGGTRWIWVVRLVGLPRVEIHEAGSPVRTLGLNDTLTAPGVLSLPVPVRALFERGAAHEATLRNLLSAKGYANLEAVLERGLARGLEKGLEDLRAALRGAIEARGWTPASSHADRIATCRDAAMLTRWITLVVATPSLEGVFAEP